MMGKYDAKDLGVSPAFIAAFREQARHGRAADERREVSDQMRELSRLGATAHRLHYLSRTAFVRQYLEANPSETWAAAEAEFLLYRARAKKAWRDQRNAKRRERAQQRRDWTGATCRKWCRQACVPPRATGGTPEPNGDVHPHRGAKAPPPGTVAPPPVVTSGPQAVPAPPRRQPRSPAQCSVPIATPWTAPCAKPPLRRKP
jgi:hypothetical protein